MFLPDEALCGVVSARCCIETSGLRCNRQSQQRFCAPAPAPAFASASAHGRRCQLGGLGGPFVTNKRSRWTLDGDEVVFAVAAARVHPGPETRPQALGPIFPCHHHRIVKSRLAVPVCALILSTSPAVFDPHVFGRMIAETGTEADSARGIVAGWL